MMIGATRTADFTATAAAARARPGTWIRIPADMCTPGLDTDVRSGRVPALPAAQFTSRAVAGVSFLGPRQDIEVQYQP